MGQNALPQGNPVTAVAPYTNSKLNITAAAVVKAAPGVVGAVSVLVAGNATGAINDCTTTAAATITNQTFTIPDTVGVYEFNWPHSSGIVVAPGTGGQTVAVTYE
jgi:hypothetical protein